MAQSTLPSHIKQPLSLSTRLARAKSAMTRLSILFASILIYVRMASRVCLTYSSPCMSKRRAMVTLVAKALKPLLLGSVLTVQHYLEQTQVYNFIDVVQDL